MFAEWSNYVKQELFVFSSFPNSLFHLSVLQMLQKTTSYVHVAQVNCQEHQHLCQREGIHSYPSMRLYPMGVGTSFL